MAGVPGYIVGDFRSYKATIRFYMGRPESRYGRYIYPNEIVLWDGYTAQMAETDEHWTNVHLDGAIQKGWLVLDPIEPGLTASEHKILRQLIHFIEDGPAEGFVSGAYKETLPSGDPFPTSEIWWESSLKLKKIVELTTTWSGVTITQEVWEVYNTDGITVLATVTDVISYSGIFETSRTRTIA